MDNRILIVEDEAITALDLKLGLEDLGYTIIDTVATGQKAIDTAAETRPDVVLMDIKLKEEMTGIEAAEKILALSLPVIYLTANTDDFTFKEANAAGSYGFIEKPYNINKLDNLIKLAINRSKIETEKVNLAQGFIKEKEKSKKEEIKEKHKKEDKIENKKSGFFGFLKK